MSDELSPSAGPLRALHEDRDAPPWTHPRSDRLTMAMLAEVRRYATLVAAEPPAWQPGGEPAWLRPWLADVWQRTPAYRERGPLPDRLADLAPIGRTDLARGAWPFVPIGTDLDTLIQYTTSGTAGAPVLVPSDPVTVASYYPLVLSAARPRVDVRPRAGHLDWVTVISQEAGGFVIPSWSSTLGCLTAQINLRPHTWRSPGDRERFLERHDPQVITGDPVAFADLLALQARLAPRLLVSAASALSSGLRERLERAFGAVVLDLYSLTESGPVATALTAGGPHHLIQPRLFVEALRPDGSRAEPGERGELALTGGLNRVLPLVRYRTGDHGALVWPRHAATPVVAGLEGRVPVVFRRRDGGRVNSHSVTVALEPLALARFALREHAPGRYTFAVDPQPSGTRDAALATLRSLLGDDAEIAVETLEPGTGKVVPFSARGRRGNTELHRQTRGKSVLPR